MESMELERTRVGLVQGGTWEETFKAAVGTLLCEVRCR